MNKPWQQCKWKVFLFLFYKKYIYWKINRIKKIIKEIKWDLYEARKYNCKPRKPWWERLDMFRLAAKEKRR